MRQEFQTWILSYPTSPAWRDPNFANSPLITLVGNTIPDKIVEKVPGLGGMIVKGSVGQGGWTHTPWVALLDQAVTSTVEEGFYLVYLLSHGSDRLYLVLGQGCTVLKNAVGITHARAELTRRADVMRGRVRGRNERFQQLQVNLATPAWRASLYESGAVLAVEYDARNLPDEEEMIADLSEGLHLYRHIRAAGGWDPDDVILTDALANSTANTLEQAKRYRQHRSIERQSSHSRRVKRLLGTRCMGCDVKLTEKYGTTADGVIDAHHLVPLSSLHDGEIVQFDPAKDFVVLCPNCHRVIHKMADVSDLTGLRQLIKSMSPITH